MANQHNPTKREKQQLQREFETFVLELLRVAPVMKLVDLEQKVHEKFAERIAAAKLDQPLKSGRVEWKNSVDWVKAHLTQRGWTRYFSGQKEEYLAFLPPCGQVDGVGLVKSADAARVCDALIVLITK